MADGMISKDQVLDAFAAIGRVVGGYDEIEIVLVGGMAARLAGWLDPLQTTDDCDVMVYVPERFMGYIEQEAYNVGRERGLPRDWLNSRSRMFEWVLPSDWPARKCIVGRFGLLIVSHVGRLDLITLKVYASRDEDRAHLIAMKVSGAELDFAERHLESLRAHPAMTAQKTQAIRDTLEILRSM